MLDLSKPVYVKKQILDVKTQNTYPIDMERPYRSETIPVMYRNDIYLTNDNSKKPAYTPPESIPPSDAVIMEPPVSPSSGKKVNVNPPAVS